MADAQADEQADDVLYEKRDDGVAVITLNRPKSLNAMGGQLMLLLPKYLQQDDIGNGRAQASQARTHEYGRGGEASVTVRCSLFALRSYTSPRDFSTGRALHF